MLEQKGLKYALLRTPTRIVCFLLLLIVALVVVHTIQFTPNPSTTAPDSFYTDADKNGTFDWNSSSYTSDFYTDGQLDVMKVGIIAGALVGAIILAWLLAFLPKKTPLILFPIVGGVVAFIFVIGLKMQPQGESATIIDWVAKKITDNEQGHLIVNEVWRSEEYCEIYHNRPYDLGYVLFLYPVMYVVTLIMGEASVGYGWVALNDFVWLQYVNVVLLAIAVYMILRATARLFGKNAAQIAGLLSVAFVPLAMFVVELSAEIPALFFASIAIERAVAYLKNEKRLGDGSVIKRRKKNKSFGAAFSLFFVNFLNVLLISVCMTLAVLIKVSYVVLAVTLAFLFLLDMIRNKRLLNLVPLAVMVALVVITIMGIYPAAFLTNNVIFFVSDIPAFPPSDPTGSTVNPSGEALGIATNRSEALLSSEATIYQKINFLYRQWNDPSFSMIGRVQAALRGENLLYIDPMTVGFLPLNLFNFELAQNAGGNWDAWLAISISNAVSNVIFLFAILGLVMCIVRASVERLALPLYALGGVLFHLFFGLSPISSFPYFLALIGLAGYGLASLAGLLHRGSRRDDPLSTRKKKSPYRKFLQQVNN